MPALVDPTKEKEGFLSFIIGPFQSWIDFLKTNGVSYYLGLLKITLAQILAVFALTLFFTIIGAGIVFLVGGAAAISSVTGFMDFLSGAFILILILLAVLAIIAVICINWVSDSINMSSYIYTDNEFNRKPFDMIQASGRIKWSVLRYMVLKFFLWIILLIPLITILAVLFLIGGGALMSGGSMGGMITFMLASMIGIFIFQTYVFFVGLAFEYLIQFWLYGFVIEGLGVIDSFKRNFSLIRRRFFEFIAFNFILIFGVLAILIPFYLFNFFMNIILEVINVIAREYSAWAWLIYFFVFIVFATIYLLMFTLLKTFYLPTHYLFWRKVRKGLD